MSPCVTHQTPHLRNHIAGNWASLPAPAQAPTLLQAGAIKSEALVGQPHAATPSALKSRAPPQHGSAPATPHDGSVLTPLQRRQPASAWRQGRGGHATRSDRGSSLSETAHSHFDPFALQHRGSADDKTRAFPAPSAQPRQQRLSTSSQIVHGPVELPSEFDTDTFGRDSDTKPVQGADNSCAQAAPVHTLRQSRQRLASASTRKRSRAPSGEGQNAGPAAAPAPQLSAQPPLHAKRVASDAVQLPEAYHPAAPPASAHAQLQQAAPAHLHAGAPRHRYSSAGLETGSPGGHAAVANARKAAQAAQYSHAEQSPLSPGLMSALQQVRSRHICNCACDCSEQVLMQD